MNTLQKIQKRKLLFDFFNDSVSPEHLLLHTGPKKINHLKHNGVGTVFIISSEAVDPDIYIKLINEYARNDFEIKSIHLDNLDGDNLPIVKYQVENISSSLSAGGCLILSYGNSQALVIVACLFILTGKNFYEALDITELISRDKKLNEREKLFIKSFEDYLSNKGFISDNGHVIERADGNKVTGDHKDHVIEPVPDKVEVIEEREAELIEDRDKLPRKIDEADVKETDVIKKVKAQISGEDAEKAEPLVVKKPAERVDKKEKKPQVADEGKLKSIDMGSVKGATGRFYSSIRFKLVSIVSMIIILSLLSMILVATYFFKKDNIIRVQENNLNISEVIALKMNTDINTNIDKAKFLINSIKKGEGKGRDALNIQDLLIDDNEIIFTALIDMPGKIEAQNPSYIIYNRQLINKMQLLEKDIAEAYNVNSPVFIKSFEGAKIIYNISKVIENQTVMAVSLPFIGDRERRINAIAVIFINVDNILKTFNPKGITKTFMVNDRGEVVLHPDKTLMQSGANMSDLPIVSIMMKSALDNGQTRFSDSKNTVLLGSFKKLGFGGAGVVAFSEEELALQEVYNIQRRNLYLMVSVLSIAVLIVFFFGKSLTSPISRLVRATDYIKEGHYLVDIKPASNDEIGQLTSSFVEMGRGLDEREKMKVAFGKFVNKEIAERALHGEIRLGGERIEAAVFFCDIRSFTAISEKLEPEEVVEFLNEYMTRMVKCVNDTNGMVDKYIGDAIMAEWGVPISKGNDTENAVNAALMMRLELIKFNEGRGGDKKPQIKIGCGINSGPVLAGQIGSEDRMEYTVIGDTVNLASRIEQLNKPFGTDVLISEDSYNLVKDIFNVEKMAPITVKGKADKQQIYAVLGRVDDPAAPKNLVELRSMLGITEMKFNRRNDDSLEEEVKYEILGS